MPYAVLIQTLLSGTPCFASSDLYVGVLFLNKSLKKKSQIKYLHVRFTAYICYELQFCAVQWCYCLASRGFLN